MKWVAHAASRPHRCAAIPFIGNSNAKQGFIDTGMELAGWDPHVYVSVEAVQEMARMIGWQPVHIDAASRARAHARTRELSERVAQLEAENHALLEFKNAVDVMASADFIARRKPGRPPKQEAVA